MFTILPFLLLLPFPAPPTAAAARCRRCCGRRLCRAHRPCVFRSPSNDEVRRRPDAGPDPSAEFSEKIVGKSIVRAPHLHSKEDAENGTSGEGEGEREVDEIQPMCLPAVMSAVLLTNQSPLSPQNRCWEAFVMALCPGRRRRSSVAANPSGDCDWCAARRSKPGERALGAAQLLDHFRGEDGVDEGRPAVRAARQCQAARASD